MVVEDRPHTQWECHQFLFNYDDWQRQWIAHLPDPECVKRRAEGVSRSIQHWEMLGWCFEPSLYYELEWL